MRYMSFALTTEQVRNQTKFVTRRFGWWNAPVGTIVQPAKKCMGLKKGEKVSPIGPPIEFVSVGGEALNLITPEDVIREGFPDWTPEQFVEFLVKKHRCKPSDVANRIEFRYL